MSAQLLEQNANLCEYFLQFLPTTSSFKKTVSGTARYKRISETLKSKDTIAYLGFIAFVANDFQIFFDNISVDEAKDSYIVSRNGQPTAEANV